MGVGQTKRMALAAVCKFFKELNGLQSDFTAVDKLQETCPAPPPFLNCIIRKFCKVNAMQNLLNQLKNLSKCIYFYMQIYLKQFNNKLIKQNFVFTDTKIFVKSATIF